MNLQESERFLLVEQRLEFVLDVLVKKGLVVIKEGKLLVNEEDK